MKKPSGFSLIIALGVSSLTVVIAMGVLHSVMKTFEQTVALERSNQVFFATESGLEAGFFHHNARGHGLVLNANPVINHGEIDADVTWTINARADSYASTLRENQKVEIPLSWDSSDDIGDVPNTTGAVTSTTAFKASFAHDDSFDYGNEDITTHEKVLINWSLVGTDLAGDRKTFTLKVPTEEDGGICDTTNSEYLCQQNPSPLEIDFTINYKGLLQPGNTEADLNTFLAYSNKKLSFQPLLSFTSADGFTHKNGIDFSISNTGAPFPLPSYTLTSSVNMGKYRRERVLTIPERTSLGAFDYVILD